MRSNVSERETLTIHNPRRAGRQHSGHLLIYFKQAKDELGWAVFASAA
jgi:hypothetical protein